MEFIETNKCLNYSRKTLNVKSETFFQVQLLNSKMNKYLNLKRKNKQKKAKEGNIEKNLKYLRFNDNNEQCKLEMAQSHLHRQSLNVNDCNYNTFFFIFF